MLAARIRKLWQPRWLSIALLALAGGLSSCASNKPQAALVSDPDAQPGSSIPWNKPANWEGRGNLPGGLGASGQGQAFGGENGGGTGGY